tara:strand:- start:2 stop:349 length:348 start_codon:yes stop_codon:yes gene_type:complete
MDKSPKPPVISIAELIEPKALFPNAYGEHIIVYDPMDFYVMCATLQLTHLIRYRPSDEPYIIDKNNFNVYMYVGNIELMEDIFCILITVSSADTMDLDLGSFTMDLKELRRDNDI